MTGLVRDEIEPQLRQVLGQLQQLNLADRALDAACGRVGRGAQLEIDQAVDARDVALSALLAGWRELLAHPAAQRLLKGRG